MSLKLEEGEIVTLIGSNGAGKTKILRIVCGLKMPSTKRAGVKVRESVECYRRISQTCALPMCPRVEGSFLICPSLKI